MRVILILLFFLNILYSTSFIYPDFKKCYKRDIKSTVYFGDTKAIAISKHYAIAYLKKKPKYPFVKYDPFLNLYLFYRQKPMFFIKLKDTDKLTLGEWLASMDENSMYVGNFSQRGIGLNIYFEQNSKTPPNSMISCLCCDIYGLGVGSGKFISSNFIKRFLHSSEIFYGDIGARFAKRGRDIVVSFINPLFKNQKLKVGDIIRQINNRKVYKVEDIEDFILFQKRDQTVKIEFIRDNKIQTLSIKVKKRYGGGELSDSFLENRGIFFDKKLKIIGVAKGSFAQKSGLKIGDKLLQIDRVNVKDQNSVKSFFSKTQKKSLDLLFDRDDFQFFVKVAL